MATNFPTTLDSFTARSNGQVIDATHVQNLQDAVAALEAKVGANSSAVATSLDYIVNHPTGSGPTGLWVPADQGLNAWNFDPMICDASSNATNIGTPYYNSIHVATGTLTKIYYDCSATGTATHYACLYNAAGTLLQQSAGVVPSALGLTTFTIPSQAVTAGLYLVMVYGSSAAGTVASFRRKNNLVANNVANLGMTSPMLRAGSGSQTTLTTTAPATTGTLTNTGVYYWVAVGP